MCPATTDRGGPRRCSADTRAAYANSAHAVAVLEDTELLLKGAFDDQAPAPVPVAPKVVSFADKKTRIEAIRAEIDTAIGNLNTAAQWQEWLEYTSRFPNRSLRNQLLIRMQRPDATFVLGFGDWKDLGRDIIEGTKAIWINAPKFKKKKDLKPKGSPPADDDNEKVMVGALPVPVYDVAQTTGDPLPQRPNVPYTRETGTAPPEMHSELQNRITDHHGFTVEYADLPENGPEGYTDFTNKKVVVSTRHSDAHQAMVLAHELAHIELGHGDKCTNYHSGPGGERPTMEVEAESVAYVIGRHYGLTPAGSSFGYIDGWAKGDKDKVAQTGDRVVKACDRILRPLMPAAPGTN